MYYSKDQARMRLTGCIVKLNGEWVKVHGVDGDDHAMLLKTYPVGNLPDREEDITITVIGKHCGLDARPMKLGYINTFRGWEYVYRIPQRRWKQGLHIDNIRCKDLRAGHRAFNTKGMLDCLNNMYMSIETALKGGGAFNRYFMIDGENLWYRGTKVGSIDLNGTKRVMEELERNRLKPQDINGCNGEKPLPLHELREQWLNLLSLDEKYLYLQQQLERALK